MRAMDSMWLTLFGFVMALGQLLFKRAAITVTGRRGEEMAVLLLTTPSLWAAFAMYGAATILWIWILTRVPLSQAYPFVALGMILVPLASVLVYGERVTPLFWLGSCLVMIGIVLTQRGAG